MHMLLSSNKTPVRFSKDDVMDDVERAIDDGFNAFECLKRSPKLVAGAGAIEIKSACRVMAYVDELVDLKQFANSAGPLR